MVFPVYFAADLCLCSAQAGIIRHQGLHRRVYLHLRGSVMGIWALISIPDVQVHLSGFNDFVALVLSVLIVLHGKLSCLIVSLQNSLFLAKKTS